MLEVEVKAHVPDRAAAEARAAEAGFVLRHARTDEDVYWTHPCRSFAETDEALRFRTTTRDSGDVEVLVTYKGPRTGDTGKVREEIELPAGDALQALFERLGFEPFATVTKRRVVHQREDGLVLTFDEVPELGDFLEVETDDPGRAAEVRDLALALAGGPEEPGTYLGLVLAKRGVDEHDA